MTDSMEQNKTRRNRVGVNGQEQKVSVTMRVNQNVSMASSVEKRDCSKL